MKSKTEMAMKQAGYVRKEVEDYDSDNDRWFVKSVSYIAPDGVEMDMAQAVDEVNRGAAIVRAEMAAKAAALAEKRAARAAAEAAALVERSRVRLLPVYAGDRNLPFTKTHEGKGFAVCSAAGEGGTVYAIQDTVTWYAEYRFEAAVVETPAQPVVETPAAAQPEPVEVAEPETQEEEPMNDFDPYAQDRADGEAQEKRETAPAADPNSDLTAIIAADDADAADEAEMRAVYAPAADPNSDLRPYIEAGEPGGLVWDSSGHLARYTADGMTYNRLTAAEILTVSADEYAAFTAAHAAEFPNEWQPTWEEMQDRAQAGETPSAVNWY